MSLLDDMEQRLKDIGFENFFDLFLCGCGVILLVLWLVLWLIDKIGG